MLATSGEFRLGAAVVQVNPMSLWSANVVEIACRHCGQKVMSDELVAAQQQCGHCGQLAVGEAAPPMIGVAAEDDPSAGTRGLVSFRWWLIFGAVAGGAFALSFGLATAGAPGHVRGLILGTFGGVLLFPFAVLALALGLLLTPLTPQGMMADLFLSGVVDRASERNYKPLLAVLALVLVLCMALGAFYGYRANAAELPVAAHNMVMGGKHGAPPPAPGSELALLLPAVLGGALLGAGLSGMCAVTSRRR
jgi:hypothetical protein